MWLIPFAIKNYAKKKRNHCFIFKVYVLHVKVLSGQWSFRHLKNTPTKKKKYNLLMDLHLNENLLIHPSMEGIDSDYSSWYEHGDCEVVCWRAFVKYYCWSVLALISLPDLLVAPKKVITVLRTSWSWWIDFYLSIYTDVWGIDQIFI